MCLSSMALSFFAFCRQLALFYSDHQGGCDSSTGSVTVCKCLHWILDILFTCQNPTQASCTLASIFAWKQYLALGYTTKLFFYKVAYDGEISEN